ncbi:hypothetical protein TNCV_3682731 [Trichonephila clavipes]|uniref:Histone-lysine N-methyltransferase SETMAR n=1 Tax=Trichonephila clavipes TaxID=2585209 RepID=A0A8X6RFN2_TRICX|nr:hypothetical protein TNCV_3682731 [Trichonephila clavipes]
MKKVIQISTDRQICRATAREFASRQRPAHNVLFVKQLLTDKRITVLEHPPYSPHLPLFDFYPFSKVKNAFKGTHFQSVEEIGESRRSRRRETFVVLLRRSPQRVTPPEARDRRSPSLQDDNDGH